MKIFTDIQNEGLYTGMPTLFIQFDSIIQNEFDPKMIHQILKESQQSLGLHLSSNTLYTWHHPLTGNRSQLCFSGNDPMLFQTYLNQICFILDQYNACPPQITIQTDALNPIKELNIKLLTQHLHLSCYPKVDSIQYEVLENYFNECDTGEILFTHDGTQALWDQIDLIMKQLPEFINVPEWSFWILPQNDSKSLIKEALFRGFNVNQSIGITHA